ncbi:MAG: transposase [Rhodospirillales bacterium]|nr:transposase [Rhodospirillales bacterium]
MGRPPRRAADDEIYHVLNRASGAQQIFATPDDYAAFERVLVAAHDKVEMRTLAYCVMPNHWHLVLWPRRGGDLSRFVGWLSLTHTQRWHAHRGTAGSGHLYQGRFKSFPVQNDGHFLAVCRYVERNALRAGLAGRAEDWRWSSLWRRTSGGAAEAAWLSAWPLPEPADWCAWVNQPQSAEEVEALRRCVARGRPYGDTAWTASAADRLGLASTLSPRGRPKKGVRNLFQEIS